jgi:hypothetical protein
LLRFALGVKSCSRETRNQPRANANARGGGDRFAAAGAGDGIRNLLQKPCEQALETFLRYFASASIAAICRARLGPTY